MDDYFIKNIPWHTCTNPINAIDFSASLSEIEELAAILEMVGMPFHATAWDTAYNISEDEYFTLDIKETHTMILTCDDRRAPVPTQYINTIIPALILAHVNNPKSVKQVYNDFFINKKEEITPLLDQ